MTPETRAYVLELADKLPVWRAEAAASKAERERLKLESHLALERLHRAVEALKAAYPNSGSVEDLDAAAGVAPRRPGEGQAREGTNA